MIRCAMHGIVPKVNKNERVKNLCVRKNLRMVKNFTPKLGKPMRRGGRGRSHYFNLEQVVIGVLFDIWTLLDSCSNYIGNNSVHHCAQEFTRKSIEKYSPEF